MLSGVGINVLVDAVRGVCVGGLTDLNSNVFAAVMTALEFLVPAPLEDFSC